MVSGYESRLEQLFKGIIDLLLALDIQVQSGLNAVQRQGLLLLLAFSTSILQQCKPQGVYDPTLDILKLRFTSLEHDSKEEVQSAGELCTYTKTGDTFTEQHWYYCYTCKVM